MTAHRLLYNERHFLVVDSGRFQETYRKVAFSDVCGLSISESNRRKLWAFVYSGIIVSFFVISSLTKFQYPFTWIIAGVAVLPLIVNFAKGQSYTCTLSTAFSDIQLKTISRKSKAFAFKEFLDEKVRPIQGELTPEAARMLIEEKDGQEGVSPQPEPPIPSEASKSSPPPIPETPVISHATNAAPPPLPVGKLVGKIHWGFVFAIATWALSCLASYLFLDSTPPIIGLAFVVSMSLSIFAYIRKIEASGGPAIATTFATAIVYHVVAAIAAYMLFMTGAISQNTAGTVNIYQTTSIDTLGFEIFSLVNAIIAGAIALISGLQLNRIK